MGKTCPTCSLLVALIGLQIRWSVGGLIQLWLKSALALAQLAAEQMIPVTSVIKQTIDKNLKDHGVDWREEESEGWLAIRLNTDYEDNNTGSRRNRDS